MPGNAINQPAASPLEWERAVEGPGGRSDGVSPGDVGALRRALHDLNNVVTSLLSSSHVLRHELPADHDLRDVVGDIEAAGQRAERLTKAMRHILGAPDLPPSAPPRPTQLNGTETVLLVEDEATVMRTIARILEGAGYTVLQAEHGEQALQHLAEQGDAIDLLLTDYWMPGITGDELARRVREACPAVKVLLMSGYLGHQSELASLDFGAALLPKPFTAQSLMTRVRETLDARSPVAVT